MPDRDRQAALLAELHVLAERRSLDVIARLRSTADTPRVREAFWIAMEAAHGHYRGEPTTLKALSAMAAGTVSAPTLSRAVDDLERLGWVTSRPDTRDPRVLVIEPTERALDLLRERAEDGVAAFRAVLGRAGGA